MCHYNALLIADAKYFKLKEMEKSLEGLSLFRPMQSGFDYREWPVIIPSEDCKDVSIVEMEWGFLPPYLKNREAAANFRTGYKKADGKWQPGITTLNAIGEEMLLPGKMYRDAALKRRCLVFSSGFYEWRHIVRLNKRTGLPLKTADKYPYHISLKDAPYFLMAGIWQPWTDKETGETVNTFAICTTEANPLLAEVHNSKRRMPTILPDALAAEWISDGLTEERITQLATYQLPADQMHAYTIRKDFREAANPTEPFTYEDLPELPVS